ncbi:deubiquitinase OTUD6B-like isoform X2 [Oratosquilla oratoria]
MSDEEDLSPEEQLLSRHRKEKKDLQAQIMQLKKHVNKDKKKKKEIADEIVKLEKDLQERHEKELAELENEEVIELANDVSTLEITENGFDDCESTPQENVSGKKKISKAEKRRQKKAEANREREDRIKEEEANNRFSARAVETEKLRGILLQRNLRMYEIKPDGNCMYAAIAHQLPEYTVSQLRASAADFILNHVDDFLPFLTNPKTGDLLTQEEFVEYCSQVRNSPVWGGQPELRAISQAIKVKIVVLQAEGLPSVIGEEFESVPIVTLTYYRHYFGLGEHYNSVAPVSLPASANNVGS